MATTANGKAADKHPYMSGTAGLMQAVTHFRKSFPTQVSADTFKKLGIAPNNESYVLNILRFVDVLDADGNKTSGASTTFNQHEDADFQVAFGKLVKIAYKDLFTLHGDDAWTLPSGKLISFFRNSDHTSAIVGQRQTSTFQALAVLSGKLEGGAPKTTPSKAPQPKITKKAPAQTKQTPSEGTPSPMTNSAPAASINGNGTDVGLTVRIEINLPAAADQETYDRIFKSIRENLLNAKSS
ncbi:MAG: DUF5343 domain-containing protein [Xanthomonadales bacterium]|nr:DUF5343 domain-containing protein [Xanthomonadales bacterium]